MQRSITQLASLLTIILSLLIAVAVPLAYFSTAYQYMTGSIAAEIEFAARAVEDLVVRNPTAWQFEEVRIQEILNRHLAAESPDQRRVLDLAGQSLAFSGQDLQGPVLNFTRPIYDSGEVVGRIEIRRSIRPLVVRTALITAGSALAGGLFMTAFYLFPLGAIRRIYDKLRENESRLSLALESGKFGVLDWDIPSDVMLWNSRMYEIYGISQTPAGISREAWLMRVHPEDRARFSQTLEPEIIRSMGYDTDFRILTPDGQLRYIKADGALFLNAKGEPLRLICINSDITNRKYMEAAVVHSEQRFRLVAQCANDAFITINSRRLIIFWNRMAECMFGYSAEEVLGLDIALIMPARFRFRDEFAIMMHDLREVMAVDAATSGRTTEMTGIRKDGAEFPAEISISAWEIDGKQFFTTIIRDITERTRLEEMLRAKNHHLEKTQRELKQVNQDLLESYAELKATQSRIMQQEKMASIGLLAAGMAHEINNPIGFIISNLNSFDKYTKKLHVFLNACRETLAGPDLERLIAQYRLDFILEDIHDLIRESLDGAERVKRLVLDLKNFSRVDEVEYKVADVNECLSSTLNIVWNELKYKARVTKDLGEVPPTGCYPQQLNQVFMNLLVNAAQAIETKGEIKVKTYQDRDAIVIEISDTGSGIAPEVQERIFEPFFTTKPLGQGTGLGLSITYDIVKKHGGELTVASQPGAGTTFTVRLPVTDEPRREMRAGATSSTMPG